MHYRNGREAKNGDKVVQLGGSATVSAVGILYDAVPGNNFCNGFIAPMIGGGVPQYACLCDCLHADDLFSLLIEKGLDKRPNDKGPG